jgi:hypothetical protein
MIHVSNIKASLKGTNSMEINMEEVSKENKAKIIANKIYSRK